MQRQATPDVVRLAPVAWHDAAVPGAQPPRPGSRRGSFTLPRQPDLSAGLCASGKWPTAWWTGSQSTRERKDAIALCQVARSGRARTRAYEARRRLLDRESINAAKRAAYAARKAARQRLIRPGQPPNTGRQSGRKLALASSLSECLTAARVTPLNRTRGTEQFAPW